LLSINIICFWNFLSCLLEHPVILIIIVMPSFIHQVLEDFPHIIIVGSLLELQIPAIL